MSTAQGTPSGQVAFGPWGEPRSTASGASRLGFQGQLTDPDTGQVDMTTRLYQPSLGRFLTRDVLFGEPTDPLTLNQFAYTSGSPLTYADPLGMGQTDANGRVHQETRNKKNNPPPPPPPPCCGQNPTGDGWTSGWAFSPPEPTFEISIVSQRLWKTDVQFATPSFLPSVDEEDRHGAISEIFTRFLALLGCLAGAKNCLGAGGSVSAQAFAQVSELSNGRYAVSVQVSVNTTNLVRGQELARPRVTANLSNGDGAAVPLADWHGRDHGRMPLEHIKRSDLPHATEVVEHVAVFSVMPKSITVQVPVLAVPPFSAYLTLTPP
ncbi:MAG: RHS repeat-associated core domain-containing protein [Actinomycetota bacterium]